MFPVKENRSVHSPFCWRAIVNIHCVWARYRFALPRDINIDACQIYTIRQDFKQIRNNNKNNSTSSIALKSCLSIITPQISYILILSNKDTGSDGDPNRSDLLND